MSIYEDLRPLRGRLALWRIAVILLFVGLCARFWQLQIVRFAHYQELARANHVRQIPESAPRGLVFDRFGRILAENRPSFNLTLESPSGEEQTLSALARLLDVDGAAARTGATGRFGSILVKEDLSLEDVAFVESRQLELPGAMIQFVPRRYYPGGSLAAHVLGYVGRITEAQLGEEGFEGASPSDYVGQSGVELVYNARLMGRNGIRRVVVNSRGRRERLLEEIPPVWGDSVQLALDVDVQRAAEEALGERAGAVVALDPRNGEVLALASYPSFDPNFFSGRFDETQWKELVEDEEHRLQSRPLQGRYPPGSVFKLVVAAAALEEGLLVPSTRATCTGSVWLYGRAFRCHRASGHGSVDLHEALVESCNSYFYRLATKIPIETIARYARLFGLGRPTGIDLPFEASGLVPDPEWKRRTRGEPWFAGETVSVAVGQGSVLVTGLQMAQLAAIVGTAGEVHRPHVFLRSLPPGATPDGVEPGRPEEPVRRVGLSPATWTELQRAMFGVVNEGGTGWRARLPGVEVCGKTGTAQVASRQNLQQARDDERPEHLRNHGWFIGYAPRVRPEIALAVLVEHGGAGGQAAAPVARRVLEAYFDARSRRKAQHVRQASVVRD